MAQSRVKQFSMGSNEAAPDEIAQYSVNLYSTTWPSFSWNSLAYIQTVQPKVMYTARHEVVQRNIK